MTKRTREDIRERLVALTRDLILIPSIHSRPEDQRRCYEFVKNHLESLEQIEVREFEHLGIKSLVAAPKGIKKPDILMCGHIDVIGHPDLSVYNSKIEEGRIVGPGAGDMKGSVAILLEVFREIHGQISNASLGIAITTDEEQGGEAGMGFLFKEKKIRCGIAMVPDGGYLNGITVAEKGILHLRLHTKGKPAHASRPWLGKNPIELMLKKIHKLYEYFDRFDQHEEYWHPTCSLSILETENQTINRVPADATAVVDIRFPEPYTVKNMMQEITAILGDEIFVEVIISAEPTDLKPDPLFSKITEEITGLKCVQNRDHGGSDARFIAATGSPVIISRPTVGNLHATDEWIDIESMVQLYEIYERYLHEKLLKK